MTGRAFKAAERKSVKERAAETARRTQALRDLVEKLLGKTGRKKFDLWHKGRRSPDIGMVYTYTADVLKNCLEQGLAPSLEHLNQSLQTIQHNLRIENNTRDDYSQVIKTFFVLVLNVSLPREKASRIFNCPEGALDFHWLDSIAVASSKEFRNRYAVWMNRYPDRHFIYAANYLGDRLNEAGIVAFDRFKDSCALLQKIIDESDDVELSAKTRESIKNVTKDLYRYVISRNHASLYPEESRAVPTEQRISIEPEKASIPIKICIEEITKPMPASREKKFDFNPLVEGGQFVGIRIESPAQRRAYYMAVFIDKILPFYNSEQPDRFHTALVGNNFLSSPFTRFIGGPASPGRTALEELEVLIDRTRMNITDSFMAFIGDADNYRRLVAWKKDYQARRNAALNLVSAEASLGRPALGGA